MTCASILGTHSVMAREFSLVRGHVSGHVCHGAILVLMPFPPYDVLAVVGLPVEFGWLAGSFPHPGMSALPKFLLVDSRALSSPGATMARLTFSRRSPPRCSDGTNSCWAKWNVYMAESVNGHALVPGFTQYTASDHIIHSGTVSTGGLGGGADRNLADFFQVAIDPQHRAKCSAIPPEKVTSRKPIALVHDVQMNSRRFLLPISQHQAVPPREGMPSRPYSVD